jgi:hypothetical protein
LISIPLSNPEGEEGPANSQRDTARESIKDLYLDNYLMKSWDPPEERLYPVLDDLLDDRDLMIKNKKGLTKRPWCSGGQAKKRTA